MLMLMLPSSKMEKIKSSSLRSPPSSGAARHLLPQAGEGLIRLIFRGREKDFGPWENLAPRIRTTPSRSEEHTSELQSLMRISYAVFCLKKKRKKHTIMH